MKAAGKPRKNFFSFLRRKKSHGIKTPKNTTITIESPTTATTDNSHSSDQTGSTGSPITPRSSNVLSRKLTDQYELFSSERGDDDALAGAMQNFGVPFNGNGSLQDLHATDSPEGGERSGSPSTPDSPKQTPQDIHIRAKEGGKSPHLVVEPPFSVPSPKSMRKTLAMGREPSLRSISENSPESTEVNDLAESIRQRIEQQSLPQTPERDDQQITEEGQSLSWAEGSYGTPAAKSNKKDEQQPSLQGVKSPARWSPASSVDADSPPREETLPMVPVLQKKPSPQRAEFNEIAQLSEESVDKIAQFERALSMGSLTSQKSPRRVELRQKSSTTSPRITSQSPERRKRKTRKQSPKRGSPSKSAGPPAADVMWPEELEDPSSPLRKSEVEAGSPKGQRARYSQRRASSVRSMQEKMIHRRPMGPKSVSTAQLDVLQEVDWNPSALMQLQAPRSVNPLNRRLWLPAQPIDAPSCLKGRNDSVVVEEKSVQWPFQEVQEAIYPPVHLIRYLETHKEKLWWPRRVLRARSKEDAMNLRDSISARAYNRDCTRVYDALAVLIRQKRAMKDHNMTKEELTGLLTPTIARGLQLGHRGLELGGISRRLAHAEEITDEVLRYSMDEYGANLPSLSVDLSEVDRLWAYIIALGDQQAAKFVKKRRPSAR